MLIALGVLGCRPGDVVYDAVGSGDAMDDLVSATLLFGRAESDNDQIDGAHAAGATLTINVRRTHSVGGLRWYAETLQPEIARVASADTSENGLTMTLEFLKAGTTDLFVFDEHGTVVDVQTLQVRDATEAALIAWDDLAAGHDDPLEGTVDLVAGSDVSLVVTWRDDEGTVLHGGDLLVVDGSDATSGVVVSSRFTGQADVVDVSVDANAPTAQFPIVVGADLIQLERDVAIHARSEVDSVHLVQTDSPEGDGGIVQAEVEAGGVRLVGAPVQFRYDGKKVVGTGFVWESGPTTTVEACFDARCESLVLRGQPTEITGAVADSGGTCGCTGGPSGGLSALLFAAAAVRRRIRR